ncbi:hypothetical protein H0H93_000292 [Arthromyces matolae]|nr:hypothetical protein H0H93_000292 [Arthromyces matolae]
MSFTNINDPAGVTALLDQLRGSQAWKDTIGSQEPNDQLQTGNHEDGTGQASLPAASNTISNTNPPALGSVAALLSQLQSAPLPVQNTVPGATSSKARRTYSPPPPSFTGTNISVDPRSLSFQQALPYITQLANDPKFVTTLKQLKQEQEDLERQLWEERRDIVRKYEEKVKIATTKATMIGDPGLSKHEADMLQEGLKKALVNFDRDRVLIAWDGLVSKQQLVLLQHKVPTMFSTIQQSDRERQNRIIDVLEGILQT